MLRLKVIMINCDCQIDWTSNDQGKKESSWYLCDELSGLVELKVRKPTLHVGSIIQLVAALDYTRKEDMI